jgi:secreted PhoX family phosphatase
MHRPQPRPFSRSRRAFLRGGVTGVLSLGVLGGQLVRVPAARAAACGGADTFGPLLPPNANGLRLPPGFSSRIVAVSQQPPVATSSYRWPSFPDGGATFATGDGGWIYVANSEAGPGGGAAALRFAGDGVLADAYPILTGTARNCAGGPTPWGRWLSCEELPDGRVWECNPFVPFSQGVVRPALGSFNHEACAVDPIHQTVYLTEDAVNGRLYRFTPDDYPDLAAGTLETAEILDPLGQGPIQPGQVRPLAWHALAAASPAAGGALDASRLALAAPQARLPQDSQDPVLLAQDPEHLPLEERATRFQVAAATPFARGEGCWYEAGAIYFATTADGRVWAIDTAAQTIRILYDQASSSMSELSGADNVFASPIGDVLVAEDGGNMQLIALTPSGDVKPIVQVMGQAGSEITGPALSPDGSRLYFSSQRGGNLGITYEVRGSFVGGCAVPTLGNAGTALLGAALATAALLSLRGRPTGEV